MRLLRASGIKKSEDKGQLASKRATHVDACVVEANEGNRRHRQTQSAAVELSS